jgi:hypothetical protein
MYSKTKTRSNTMKKTLLLSVVASTLIMAGGDIEPVAVPVVEEVVSSWDFSGQAVVYYQTLDDADFLGTDDPGLLTKQVLWQMLVSNLEQ